MPVNQPKPMQSGLGSLLSIVQAIYGGGSGPSVASVAKGIAGAAGQHGNSALGNVAGAYNTVAGDSAGTPGQGGVTAGANGSGINIGLNLGSTKGEQPATVGGQTPNAVDRAVQSYTQQPHYLIQQGLQALKDPNYGPNHGFSYDQVMGQVQPLLEAYHFGPGGKPASLAVDTRMQDASSGSLSPDQEVGTGTA